MKSMFSGLSKKPEELHAEGGGGSMIYGKQNSQAALNGPRIIAYFHFLFAWRSRFAGEPAVPM